MAKRKLSRVAKIPTFVQKLSQILNDSQLSNLISWLPDGNGFQIYNVPAFTEQVLPNQFKHKNMASFVRQLNMYGFSRPSDSHQHVYMHPRFQKGNPSNMKFIKRKAILSKQDNSFVDSESNSEQEECPKKSCNEQYCRIKIENQQLKKENEELRLRLSQYENMKYKVQNYSNQINRCLELAFDETENEKIQKQANSSDSTQENPSMVGKSSFSICKNNCGLNNLSYNLLLKGSKNSQIKAESS